MTLHKEEFEMYAESLKKEGDAEILEYLNIQEANGCDRCGCDFTIEVCLDCYLKVTDFEIALPLLNGIIDTGILAKMITHNVLDMVHKQYDLHSIDMVTKARLQVEIKKDIKSILDLLAIKGSR